MRSKSKFLNLADLATNFSLLRASVILAAKFLGFSIFLPIKFYLKKAKVINSLMLKLP